MVPGGGRIGVLLDGLDVTDEIRTEGVSANSRYAAASATVSATDM